MLSKPAIATLLSSLYMLIYLVFFSMNNFNVVFPMFLAAPVVLIWLAYTIIRFGKYNDKDLREDEEWGYSDKPRT